MLIDKAYGALNPNEAMVYKYNVKNIVWNDDVSKEETACEVAGHFGFI